ncbi:MAG TPA: tRNA pseudouridine(55) synthase TruB [Aquihabitans sp.]|jgi:tRNA pseudouridine55 synthase|nr:tRNA pseudouridine(55) synthase TruB [Aquihabitans sp.]
MARRPHTGPDGLVVVDKPAGWTSHDVVAKSRGLLGTRKVGHAGTLDPDATGVLLLGVGRATKLLRFLSPLGKSYVGEVVLGTETSTLDAAGEVTATHEMGSITLDDVRAAAAGFVGEIEQVPPMVSAVKVGGRRLHELARQGIEVERDARPVTIHALEVAPGSAGEAEVFTLAVTCSSGTYVRTLAADLGTALGGGAHLRNLRRTAVGPFTLDDAVPLEGVDPERVRPMLDAVRHLHAVAVDDARAADVRVGKVLERADLGVEGDGPWAVIAPDGALLAVYEPFRDTTTKPSLVIAP